MDNGLLTIPSDPPNGFSLDLALNITSCKFLNGFPEDYPVNSGEPITAMGVDFSRLRILRQEFKPFTMDVLSARADWADAVTTARLSRQGRYRKITVLTISIGGATYVWNNVAVIDVIAAPIAATVIGSTDFPSATAAVVSSWTLQLLGF